MNQFEFFYKTLIINQLNNMLSLPNA
jgi:hypothetical protein